MQYQSLTRQTPPTVEPVTLAEAKQHLRVDTNDDDGYIAGLIRASREWVEAYLDRTLVLTQWTMRLEEFPEEIELPRPPVATAGTATAVTITYTMASGSTATLDATQYRVDRHSTPGEIYPLYAGTWPVNREDEDAITVTWWGGYGANASDVPQAIRHAMLMLIGHWYEVRSGVLAGSISKPVEFAVESLLSSQKWGGYR